MILSTTLDLPVFVERPALFLRIVSAWRAADLAVRALILVFLVLSPVTLRAAAPIDSRIIELDRALIAAGAADRAEQLAATYREWKIRNLSGDSSSHLGDAVLHESFRAGARVSQYLGDTPSLLDLEEIYLQMVGRNIAGRSEHLAMYGALIQNREFPRAVALAKRENLSVPDLPVISGARSDKQGVLQTSKDGRLEWRPWIYRKGYEVIAYVSPSCGFSRVAMKSISEEVEWSWIRPNIRLIVRRAPFWPYPGVSEWNEVNELLPMQSQAAAVGWGALDVLETPVFHVVQDGAVIKTIYGWQDSGAELAEMRGYFTEGH